MDAGFPVSMVIGKGGRQIELMMRLAQYPLSERMLKPASNPAYYDALIKEIDEAPKRSWFGRFVNKWKGFIRLS